jgi:hypothetical protein
LIERGEADLRLELDAGSPKHAYVGRGGTFDGGLQKGGLPDTWLTHQKERFALNDRSAQKRIDQPELALASDQCGGEALERSLDCGQRTPGAT